MQRARISDTPRPRRDKRTTPTAKGGDSAAGEEARTASAGVAREAPHARVLVLSGDAAFTCAVHRVLQAADYAVVESNDPRDALVAIVRGHEYDIILCDWELPVVAASDFHDQVAAMSPSLAARIVFLSPEPIATGLANAQLLTPFNADDLRRWVSDFVGLKTVPPIRRSQL